MAITHGAHELLRSPQFPVVETDLEREPETETETEMGHVLQVETPPRERAARAEIDRLRSEIEKLCRVDGNARARDAVDSALESMARLQVVTANVDACIPPSGIENGFALIALADARLSGHADAIERGMTYTADNQMRLLQADPATPGS
jgi:hypothetical protein